MRACSRWTCGVLLSFSFPIVVVGQQPATSGQPKTHVIKTGPNTVQWGWFDGSVAPILRVESGDIVEVETPLDVASVLQASGAPAELITPTTRELDAVPQKDRGPGPNILVGPIAVNGAEAGDVLEVKILELEPMDNYAENVFQPNRTLYEDLPRAKIRFIQLDRARKVALFAPGIEIPLHPFFGTMGVAPAAWLGRTNDGPPDNIGGNLDNKDLVAGTTLYLPIQQAGALFSVGDGHAGQGDGESDGTAIEIALRGKLQLTVRKDMHLLWPRAETPDAYMTMGFSPDLNRAAVQAVREMVKFLVSERHLTPEDAYMLTSMAADLHVTQIVDGTKGIHAVLPKRIFAHQ
jgi:acetamidase/formamidase